MVASEAMPTPVLAGAAARMLVVCHIVDELAQAEVANLCTPRAVLSAALGRGSPAHLPELQVLTASYAGVNVQRKRTHICVGPSQHGLR